MEYKALPFSSVWENGIFNLPTKLVDEYLKLASEYQLKALLYIFRNNGQASTNALSLKKSYRKAMSKKKKTLLLKKQFQPLPYHQKI